MTYRKERTFADELREENERLRRRFIHHTRPRKPLSMEEARALHQALVESADLAYDIEPERRDERAGERGDGT